jgi:hypothetical protein
MLERTKSGGRGLLRSNASYFSDDLFDAEKAQSGVFALAERSGRYYLV